MLLTLQEEIEKVQERRAQRERERAEQEEMQQLLQRERGMAEAMELEAKEEAVSCPTCEVAGAVHTHFKLLLRTKLPASWAVLDAVNWHSEVQKRFLLTP